MGSKLLTIGLRPVLGELERAYVAFATLFPEPDIMLATPPLIVIQSGGRRDVAGWHDANRWKFESGKLDELTIVAEQLRKPEDVLEILAHEMVHHYNRLKNVRDCTKGGNYHNKHFRQAAEGIGLKVSRSKKYGWGHTRAGPVFEEVVAKLQPDAKAFALLRLGKHCTKAPTKMKKWTCGCTTVRCATLLVAHCEQCGEEFRKAA